MTPPLYTDHDLQSEAAHCLNALTVSPGVVDIRRWLPEAYVDSYREDDGSGQTWGDMLDEAGLGEVAAKIRKLIEDAADVSRWAVDIGAEGMEPLDSVLSMQTSTGPLARIHFAVRPDMPEDMRNALVVGLGTEIAKYLPGPEETAVPISAEAAAHVLFQERLGGWPPSTFASKLLDLWTSADSNNAAHLADAFPEYAAAIALVKQGQPGIDQLRAIADGS